MTRMFQVYETDLQKLEHALPRVFDALPPAAKNDAAFQVLFEECKDVIGNIRWNYGPHTNVAVVDGAEEEPE